MKDVEIKIIKSEEGHEVEVVGEDGFPEYVQHQGWQSVLIINGNPYAVKYYDTKEEAEAETWESELNGTPHDRCKKNSCQATEIEFAVGLIMDEWELGHKWTKTIAGGHLAFRISANWNGRQGLNVGTYELCEELRARLCPTFDGVSVSISRIQEVDVSYIIPKWRFTLHIKWKDYFKPKIVGRIKMIDTLEIRKIWADSCGKLFYSDKHYPAFDGSNHHIQKFDGEFVIAMTYEKAATVEDLKGVTQYKECDECGNYSPTSYVCKICGKALVCVYNFGYSWKINDTLVLLASKPRAAIAVSIDEFLYPNGEVMWHVQVGWSDSYYKHLSDAIEYAKENIEQYGLYVSYANMPAQYAF